MNIVKFNMHANGRDQVKIELIEQRSMRWQQSSNVIRLCFLVFYYYCHLCLRLLMPAQVQKFSSSVPMLVRWKLQDLQFEMIVFFEL